MANYSISDVIQGFKNECETLQENWQGETADAYLGKVMSYYIDYAIAIEKCLQGVNEGLDEVRAAIEDDSDAIYNHAPKKL